MITREKAVPSQDKAVANGSVRSENKQDAGNGTACRCKETAKMSPGQLLKLMVSDLAFWVRAKKE